MDKKDISMVIQETLALEAEDAKSAGTVGYMARALVQATLPHRAVKGNEFTRQNGLFSLSIWSPEGLPYGSIPRLLLSWVTTEAVRIHSPVLILGPSLSAFMTELGLPYATGGKTGSITRVKNQTTRLFCSSISCRYQDETRRRGKGFNIASDYDLWWDPKDPKQMPLWESTVTLSTDFFNEITERPVPIDMAALKALKRSPMALDTYFWLTYRMSYLRKNTVIPWELLQMQFGADYAANAQGKRDFKKRFLSQLKNVLAIYDKAKVGPTDKGLLLKPSPPHIPRQPVPEVRGSRTKQLGAAEKSAQDDLIGAALAGEERPITLRTVTFEKAREAAPGLDIYYLESEWRDWIARKGETPKDPDKAFIGFCKLKAKQHGG